MNVVFVDLTAAFYHIDRRWLFKTIKQKLKSDIDCKLFDLLKTLYSSTTTALAGHELEKYRTWRETRRVGITSLIQSLH